MTDDLNAVLQPGMRVRHPDRADWGLGQVQSRIGYRVTVNFENAGKVVLDGRRIAMIPVFDETRRPELGKKSTPQP